MSEDEATNNRSKVEFYLMVISCLLGAFVVIAGALFQSQKTMTEEFKELKGGFNATIPAIEKRVDKLENVVFIPHE